MPLTPLFPSRIRFRARAPVAGGAVENSHRHAGAASGGAVSDADAAVAAARLLHRAFIMAQGNACFAARLLGLTCSDARRLFSAARVSSLQSSAHFLTSAPADAADLPPSLAPTLSGVSMLAAARPAAAHPASSPANAGEIFDVEPAAIAAAPAAVGAGAQLALAEDACSAPPSEGAPILDASPAPLELLTDSRSGSKATKPGWSRKAERSQILYAYEPCNHLGQCTAANCNCARSRHFCTRLCACSAGCEVAAAQHGAHGCAAASTDSPVMALDATSVSEGAVNAADGPSRRSRIQPCTNQFTGCKCKGRCDSKVCGGFARVCG